MLKYIIVLGCVLVLSNPSVTQPAAQSGISSERVIIQGGRSLILHCAGAGSPLILLEAGYGSDSLAWRRVQPLLAKHTRVCSYDRAGERFSDPGPYPRDLNAMTLDLHALASAAHFSKPFVLVGHSMGGMTALLYAERYQADVSALVLLDPGTAGMLKAYSSLPHAAKDAHEVNHGFAQLRHCQDLASNPGGRADLLVECSWRNNQYSQPTNEEQDRMIEQPAFWQTLLSTDLALRSPGSMYAKNGHLFALYKENPLIFTMSAHETLDERELRV